MTVDQAVQELLDQRLRDDDTKEQFEGFKSNIRELRLTCGALEQVNALMVKLVSALASRSTDPEVQALGSSLGELGSSPLASVLGDLDSSPLNSLETQVVKPVQNINLFESSDELNR